MLRGTQRRCGDGYAQLCSRQHRQGQRQAQCPRSAMRKQGTHSQADAQHNEAWALAELAYLQRRT